MWRERLQELTVDVRFAEPAGATQLEDAERELQVRLPGDLRSLLLESDGVLGQHDLSLVWAIARIHSDNLEFRRNLDFRELYMPFDPLLFFADAGNGDQFAYAITDGVIRRDDIFAWDHETDSREWVAPSLARYLEWWLTGRIKL